MKVLIDTNILVSAALNPRGTPYKAFVKAVTYPNRGYVCEQNIDELRRIFLRKFPDKMPALESFLNMASVTISILSMSGKAVASESLIRDVEDRFILRSAINANMDIILTGDKDFLESDVKYPLILSAAEFLFI